MKRKTLLRLHLTLALLSCILSWGEDRPGYLFVDGITLGINLAFAWHHYAMMEGEKLISLLKESNLSLLNGLNESHAALRSAKKLIKNHLDNDPS